MEPYIGQIQLFAFDFAPKNWAFCHGQLMSIAQNSALFALIGTTYGGDGQNTFALPDLRGRVPNGFGHGPGLSDYVMGEASGTENVTLLQSEMPMHNHLMMVSNQPAGQSSPENHVLAVASTIGEEAVNTYGTAADAIANPQTIGVSGGNQPHNNLQPFLTMNYCIALYGVFPSRG